MGVPGLMVLFIVLAALAGGCAQAVKVTGLLPAERVVPLDSPGPAGQEADLVVKAREQLWRCCR